MDLMVTRIKALLPLTRQSQLAIAAVCLGLIAMALLTPGTQQPTAVPVPDFGDTPDFAAIEDTREMKAAFYGHLAHMIHYQNDLLLDQRQHLEEIHALLENEESLGLVEQVWLEEMAAQYEIDTDTSEPLPLVNHLLHRVDVVPVELALAQAAKESGWGRSRFAVEANNLFGQWCYQPGCGVIPKNRKQGATHEVQRFSSTLEAVRRYMNNLNTHDRYRALRDIRANLRASGRSVTGMAMAKGLTFYSERRAQYVQEVRAMIRRYREFSSSARTETL
jgi:Bax protein